MDSAEQVWVARHTSADQSWRTGGSNVHLVSRRGETKITSILLVCTRPSLKNAHRYAIFDSCLMLCRVHGMTRNRLCRLLCVLSTHYRHLREALVWDFTSVDF